MNSKINSGSNFSKKISNFFYGKVFGKLAATISIYFMGRYIYNKMQVKNYISEIQVKFFC
jgi:hypothetical protein